MPIEVAARFQDIDIQSIGVEGCNSHTGKLWRGRSYGGAETGKQY